MFFIPGIFISAITFPGTIMHEISHQIFCRLFKVPVFQVVYFQFKNPTGYVLHERTNDPFKNLMISIGPFLINTIVGIFLTFPVALKLGHFKQFNDLLSIVLYWLGFSILANAFPSTGDAKALVESVLKNKQVNIFARILTAPVIGLIYVGAIGSFVWLDFVYAFFMSMALPILIANIYI